MGDSRPPDSAPVDLVNSYARRRGDRVEVDLADPAPPIDAEGAVVVLRREDRRLRSGGELLDDERGRRLVASFPADGLDDGQWRVLWGDRPTRPQIEV